MIAAITPNDVRNYIRGLFESLEFVVQSAVMARALARDLNSLSLLL